MLRVLTAQGSRSGPRPAESTTENAKREKTLCGPTIDGEVVRYEPGKVIVIRGKGKNKVGYGLAPSVTVRPMCRSGAASPSIPNPRRAAPRGSSSASPTTATTAITAEGQTRSTTEETRTSPTGVTTNTTMMTSARRIEAYEPGRTLTIIGANGGKVTFLITDKSKVPGDLVIGKTVTILPLGGSTEQTVETVTVRTEGQPQPQGPKALPLAAPLDEGQGRPYLEETT